MRAPAVHCHVAGTAPGYSLYAPRKVAAHNNKPQGRMPLLSVAQYFDVSVSGYYVCKLYPSNGVKYIRIKPS